MAVKTIPLSEAGRKLKDLLAAVEATGEPYLITDHSRHKAVLVCYEAYNTLVAQSSEGHPYIVRQLTISGGEPVIRGSRITVRHILERTQAGQSVEEILAALPHLTAAQVYAALSYYHDHRPEMDRLIEEGRPERVLAARGLTVEKVADGVAVARE